MELNLKFKIENLEELKSYVSQIEALVDKMNSLTISIVPDESNPQPEKEDSLVHPEA